MKFCLGVGITTGCIELGSGAGGRFGRSEDEAEPDDTKLCPCCGLAILPTEPIGPTAPTVPTARRHAVLKMSYGSMDGMLVSENPFHHIPGSGSGRSAQPFQLAQHSPGAEIRPRFGRA